MAILNITPLDWLGIRSSNSVDIEDRMECSSCIEFIERVEENDKMRGLPSILSLFRDKFNTFNNTGARMLDSIYHSTYHYLKITCLA